MHDVVEVTRTVLCHTHLVVCQICDWITVSGRHQAVVLFFYSEHLPLCVYMCQDFIVQSRMCDSMSIDHCGVVPINSVVGRDYMLS